MYPDWIINKEEEQKALERADRIILQFPFYWYNMPALMKKWFEEVFEYGWAFGPKGDKLKNKELVPSITIGGPEWAYQAGEFNNYSISELLKPIQQTSNLCLMNYRKIFKVHDSVRIGQSGDEKLINELARKFYIHITDPLLDPLKKLESINQEIEENGGV